MILGLAHAGRQMTKAALPAVVKAVKHLATSRPTGHTAVAMPG